MLMLIVRGRLGYVMVDAEVLYWGMLGYSNV